MSILSHFRRRSAAHPPWCDLDRCLAGMNRLGEHRSEPLAVERGHVITLAQHDTDASPRLETRITARLRPALTDPIDAPGQHDALSLTLGIRAAARLARVDHIGHTRQSAPTASREV